MGRDPDDLSHDAASRHPSGSTMPAEEVIAMSMEFDTPFDRWLRAHGIGPLRLARKAKLSRLTVFRLRKGSVGRAGTRAKLVAACSAFTGRRVTESELFGIGSQ
jgi:hypothetical protein